MFELIHEDCRNVLANMGDETVDSIVTDPPYHLTSIAKRFGPGQAPAQFGSDGAFARAARGFMGQTWDGGDIAFDPELWAECLRVLKPGGHLIAFSGSRTYHRMAFAIDLAGFEIRDQLLWLYGSGFPKSLNVGDGWGTALKPAHEPMVLARRPLVGTVAANMQAHGTGALNIDSCRVPHGGNTARQSGRNTNLYGVDDRANIRGGSPLGRFPANVTHDGSDAILAEFPANAGARAPVKGGEPSAATDGIYNARKRVPGAFHADNGSAARFFYCAKASKADREAGLDALDVGGVLRLRSDAHSERTGQKAAPRKNPHPTVKPTDLMRWLVRLVTPPGGLVFDPFTGSGSTGRAALAEGFRFLGAEMTDEYIPVAKARISSGLTLRSNDDS